MASAAWQMAVERVTVKLKVCLLENKAKHSPSGISTSCLEVVSEVEGDEQPREKTVSKNQ